VCGFWYSFGGRIIQRKETPLCVFRYIALGNVPIQCIRICLFSLSIKAFALANPSPSFLFPTLSLSLFFALSHRVSIFSLLLPHAFLLSRVLLRRCPLLLRYLSTLLLCGTYQISPPGVF